MSHQSPHHARHPRPCAVHAAARERLRRTGYSALGDLSCRFERGALWVSGSLPSYYLKQVALSTLAELEGVHEVVHEVVIERPPPVRPRAETGIARARPAKGPVHVHSVPPDEGAEPC